MAGDLHDRHTLVVTTYDRPRGVRRLLTHAVSAEVGTILLADASAAGPQAANRATVAALAPRARVRHVPFPHDCSVLDLYEGALRAVETPLLTLCADDDLIAPAFVAEAVRFLDVHPSYAACAGRQFSMACDGDVMVNLTGNRAVVAEDPHTRFLDLLRNYWSTEFATRRTAVAVAVATCATLDVFRLHEAGGRRDRRVGAPGAPPSRSPARPGSRLRLPPARLLRATP